MTVSGVHKAKLDNPKALKKLEAIEKHALACGLTTEKTLGRGQLHGRNNDGIRFTDYWTDEPAQLLILTISGIHKPAKKRKPSLGNVLYKPFVGPNPEPYEYSAETEALV